MRLQDFRCFAQAELTFHPQVTVITGANGAGKTTLLEAIHVLSRGRSFGSPDQRGLVRSGCGAAALVAQLHDGVGEREIGLQLGSGGLLYHLDGQQAGRVADMARLLPVQAIHGGVQELVHGAPDSRRRLLDWGLFHVEQDYLAIWRRFRRALDQRNAGLRLACGTEELNAWDRELVEAGRVVHEQRVAYVARLATAFRAFSAHLLEVEAQIMYLPGWAQGKDFEEALLTSRAGDMAQAVTRVGPHRADLGIELQSERARWRSSRGQQKLLGAALILSQVQLVSEARGDRTVLLIDEPQADLDADHLERFFSVLRSLPVQLVVASISNDQSLAKLAGHVFHVEHGAIKALL